MVYSCCGFDCGTVDELKCALERSPTFGSSNEAAKATGNICYCSGGIGYGRSQLAQYPSPRTHLAGDSGE
jgi:hypothetical protein